MNVYRATVAPSGLLDHIFIVAENLKQAIDVAGDASAVELLGDVIFAKGEAASKAMTGGRQVTQEELEASVTIDHLISFEDGKPYKMLRRHLAKRGLTPEQYRTKWGLPEGYPMTSIRHSEMRSAAAKSIGLGKTGAGKK